MKKPNITPGPWLQDHQYICHKPTEQNERGILRHVVAVTHGHALSTAPANARLIAAAPKMAEALNDLTEAFETLWRITCKDLPNDTLEAAKSALLAAGYAK